MADGKQNSGDLPALLHILPQHMWHDDAVIVGTRPALLALRDALDRALTDGASAMGAMPNDGEGYWLGVACVSADDMKGVPLGYAAEEAADTFGLPAAIQTGITNAVRRLIEERDRHRCAVCGRFRRKYEWHAPDGSGTVIEFNCVHVQNDGDGGLDHD